jgi:hypothetical protein
LLKNRGGVSVVVLSRRSASGQKAITANNL